MKNTLPWQDSNLRPRPVCRTNPTSDCALPTELHGIPYIFIHHTSSWKPHQPTTYAEPIRTIGLAIRIPYFNSFRLLLRYSNHSAFNSHNFPRPYTTTYLLVNVLQIRKLPLALAFFFVTVLRGHLSCRLFPRHPRLVSFDAVSAHGFARPFRITRHHSCHCVFSIFSLLAGIARCTSLGVCGR